MSIQYNVDISQTVLVQPSAYNSSTSYNLNDVYSITDPSGTSYNMIVDGWKY